MKQVVKIYISFVLLCLATGLSFGQSPFGRGGEEPVKVTTSSKIEGETMRITFKAKIEDGWHIYAQDVTEGPTPSSINIEKISGAELIGELKASSEAKSHYDNAFQAELRYYEESVEFTQEVKLLGGEYVVEGYFEYGACNDMSCTPPTPVEFAFKGKTEKAKADEKVAETPDTMSVSEEATGMISGIAKLEVPKPEAEEEETEQSGSDHSWIWIFLSSFGAGFLALLTPCVWPIIPMTVSFFLKRSKDSRKGLRDSLTYGLSIIVIYMILGLAVTAIFGPSALNAMSTSAVANIFFAGLLIVFGLSFIGAFNLSLPASWSNAVDQKAESTTGVLSIFLMAFTLALVSFSCTGPIIGLLLVEVATQGSYFGPAIGMFGFSLALALPFTLFALFPSWLKKMPRSGSWMMTVKVVLGFVELAFALKFVSVADLAYGTHILDREAFICIWAALAFVLGLFLLGIVKISHGDDMVEEENGVGATRIVCGVASLAFCLYLIPGLWGAPLNGVSAFVPPMNTQDFVLSQNQATSYNLSESNMSVKREHLTSYEEALEIARKENKPLLIDFTGYGCVNCRKMEQKVLANAEVAQMMSERVIFVSLYVDDKTALPEKQTMEDGSVLRTVGDKWSYLQRVRFGVNAQPYYVAVGADEVQIGEAYTFDEDPSHFISFLQSVTEKDGGRNE